VALLEAMAMGRAVVATRVGGVPEVVEDERSGLLVPAGDVEELARAILRLIKNPDFRARLGEAARRTVEARFSLAGMMASYAALYRELALGCRA
jgi:glycosyltransferase involved in cell wall biosynthesis